MCLKDGTYRTCVVFQTRATTTDDCGQYLRKLEISNGNHKQNKDQQQNLPDGKKNSCYVNLKLRNRDALAPGNKTDAHCTTET